MNMQNFLTRLRLLIDSGVEQQDLAAASGVAQSIISKLYNGKREDLRATTLFKLWPFVIGPGAVSGQRGGPRRRP